MIRNLEPDETYLADTPALSAHKGTQPDLFLRWNRIIERAGIDFRIALPHVAFNRRIGEFAAVEADPVGTLLSAADWARRRDEFLPSPDDDAFVASLMSPIREPGKFASWIAPPRTGIDNKPGDFAYVRLA